MPLEQLLARYGYIMGNGDAGAEDERGDDMEVDGAGAEQAALESSKDLAKPAKVEALAPLDVKDDGGTGEK